MLEIKQRAQINNFTAALIIVALKAQCLSQDFDLFLFCCLSYFQNSGVEIASVEVESQLLAPENYRWLFVRNESAVEVFFSFLFFLFLSFLFFLLLLPPFFLLQKKDPLNRTVEVIPFIKFCFPDSTSFLSYYICLLHRQKLLVSVLNHD